MQTTATQYLSCAETAKLVWTEYDSAVEWCAKRGLRGDVGNPLPPLLSASVAELIQDDVDAFMRRVADTAYGLAMEQHHRGGENE